MRTILILGCAIAAACEASPMAPTSSTDGPRRLSQTGLYRDIETRAIADGVVEFEPSYSLWSDGVSKRRWIKLPGGTQIDTSDMNQWVFPVGTKLFKEFSVAGRPIETRLIERTASDYVMTTFAWLADGSDAVEVADGVANALGSGHDIPSVSMCLTCHQSQPGRVLGFSAIQLSKDGGFGPTLASLAAANVLSNAPPSGSDYRVPGDAATAAALGYLHANCGHCHSSNGSAAITGQFLRLDVAAQTPQDEPTWKTTVNIPLRVFSAPGIALRVAAGDPAHSALVYRMNHRGDAAQMPPIATTQVDANGIQVVSAWIQSLQ